MAIGIALPVVIDPGGGPATSVHNIRGLGGIDVGRGLADLFRVPLAFDNDANLAALAEWRRGAAVGRRDFAVLAIGTGVGMGFVAAGVLVRGARGAAGEVGFLPLGADPRDDASREQGAFERAAAGPGLRRRIETAAAAGAGFAAGADFDAVATAADAGDAAARAIVDDEARLVAEGIAAVVAVLDPSLVVLSGGVGSARALLGPVRREAATLLAHPPEIATSHLGDRGPLVGAIELARDVASGRSAGTALDR
jgi:predicted NBD/HSP70 family sugar kinase